MTGDELMCHGGCRGNMTRVRLGHRRIFLRGDPGRVARGDQTRAGRLALKDQFTLCHLEKMCRVRNDLSAHRDALAR